MRRRAVLMTAAALALPALAGCADHRAEASRLAEPAFDPPAWFSGDTYAYGLFEARGGAAKFGFHTWLHGAPAADGFTLRERFVYDTGERWERTWRFTRTGPAAWSATADNVRGSGEMTVAGDVARIRYGADMPTGAPGSGRTIALRFDMVLNRLGDGMVVNRAFVSKFGVGVGRITMVFVKPGAAWPEAAGVATLPPFPRPR